MKRIFGHKQKECPKNNAKHQHYLNPKLSRKERRNPDLTDYWIEVDTSKDIQTKNINNGYNDFIAYNIDKLNGDFNQTPKVGSGLYLYIMTKQNKLNLVKIHNVKDDARLGLHDFLLYFRDRFPPAWPGAQILYSDSESDDISAGHSSYFTNERYLEMLEIQERGIAAADDQENYRDNQTYKRITSDCDVLFGGEMWYFQPSTDDNWGTVLLWNNATGHFKPSSNSPSKQLTGLPEDLYVGADWDDNEFIDAGVELINNWINFYNHTEETGAKIKIKKSKKKLKTKKNKMKKHKLYPNNIDKYVQSMHGSKSKKKSIKKSKKKSMKKLKKKSKSKK